MWVQNRKVTLFYLPCIATKDLWALRRRIWSAFEFDELAGMRKPRIITKKDETIRIILPTVTSYFLSYEVIVRISPSKVNAVAVPYIIINVNNNEIMINFAKF
jgi:hypothetical protein